MAVLSVDGSTFGVLPFCRDETGGRRGFWISFHTAAFRNLVEARSGFTASFEKRAILKLLITYPSDIISQSMYPNLFFELEVRVSNGCCLATFVLFCKKSVVYFGYRTLLLTWLWTMLLSQLWIPSVWCLFRDSNPYMATVMFHRSQRRKYGYLVALDEWLPRLYSDWS